MKITSILILLLFSIQVFSQKKEAKTPPDEITKSIDRLLYLNDLDNLSSQLYGYSLSWVYQSANQKSKEELRNTMYIKIPQLKLDKLNYPLKRNEIQTYSPIQQKLDSLVVSVTSTIKTLIKFEDYYNDSVETENYLIAKAAVTHKITPLFISISTQIREKLKNEEIDLLQQLSKISLEKDKSGNRAETRYHYNALFEMLKMQRLTNMIYSGTMNWVFNPHDSLSKKLLIADLTFDIQAATDETKVFEEQFALMQLYKSFAEFRNESSQIAASLSEEDDYEDPLTFLLVEGKLDSYFSPEYIHISKQVQEIINERGKLLLTAASENGNKKLYDIKRMLKHNTHSYTTVVEGAESLSDLELEELLNEIAKIYSRKFTHKEILEIIDFQNSKVGEKLKRQAIPIFSEIIALTEKYERRKK